LALQLAKTPEGKGRSEDDATMQPRHIAYINEVRTVTTGRDQTRMDATVHPLKNRRGTYAKADALLTTMTTSELTS
jgi:hypothetical protein